MEKRPELSERERLRKALFGLVSAHEVYRSRGGSLLRATTVNSQAATNAWHEALDALASDEAPPPDHRAVIARLAKAHKVSRVAGCGIAASKVDLGDKELFEAWDEALNVLEGSGATPTPQSMNTPEPPPAKEDSKHPACWDLVLCDRLLASEFLIPLRKDMEERDRQGAQKYGVRLHPFNGRNALVDLYQELLDAAVYSMQAIYEFRYAQRALEGPPSEQQQIEDSQLALNEAELGQVFELLVRCAKVTRRVAREVQS